MRTLRCAGSPQLSCCIDSFNVPRVSVFPNEHTLERKFRNCGKYDLKSRTYRTTLCAPAVVGGDVSNGGPNFGGLPGSVLGAPCDSGPLGFSDLWLRVRATANLLPKGFGVSLSGPLRNHLTPEYANLRAGCAKCSHQRPPVKRWSEQARAETSSGTFARSAQGEVLRLCPSLHATVMLQSASAESGCLSDDNPMRNNCKVQHICLHQERMK